MPFRKWPKPADAQLILDMRFKVVCFMRGKHCAELTIEFKLPGKISHYHHEVAHGPSWESAMRNLIQKFENTKWFHTMKAQGVYFRVRGEGMDTVYRGYL